VWTGSSFAQVVNVLESCRRNRARDPFIVHDIITAVNGSPIKNSSDFYNYINNKSVGDKVVLTTMHDGVTQFVCCYLNTYLPI